MKLTISCGKARFVMRAGNDIVVDDMPEETATRIVENGVVTESDSFTDYPICVDNKFYFAGTFESED